jgi:PsbN protein
LGKPFILTNFKQKIIMESPAFFFTFFLWFLLLSATGYSVYVSFGPPSKKLRDPFEEHED